MTRFAMPPCLKVCNCQRRPSEVIVSPLHHQIGVGPNSAVGDVNRFTSSLENNRWAFLGGVLTRVVLLS